MMRSIWSVPLAGSLTLLGVSDSAFLVTSKRYKHDFLVTPTPSWTIPRTIRRKDLIVGGLGRLQASVDDETKNQKSSSNEEQLDFNDDDDLPSWIRGLNQWPLTTRPPETVSTTKLRENDEGSQSSEKTLSTEDPIIKRITGLSKKMTPEEEQQALLEGTIEAAKSRIGNLLNVQALLSLGSTSSSTRSNAMNFLEALNAGAKGESRGDGEMTKSNMLAQVDEIISNINASSAILSDSQGGASTSNSYNLLSPLALNTTASVLEELSAWDQWMDRLQSSMTNLRDATSNTTKFASAADSMLKQATTRLEGLLSEASTVVSPATVGDLIFKASQAVLVYNATSLLGGTSSETEAAVADTVDFATTLVSVADSILRQGYVRGDPAAGEQQSLLQNVPKVPGNDRALFDDFSSAAEMNQYSPPMAKAAEMGVLSGSIYDATPLRMLALSHSIVAAGVTSDVQWTITDSMANENDFTSMDAPHNRKGHRKHKHKKDENKGNPIAVRTIVIRGFDASDENVDREGLVTRVCLAAPQSIEACGSSSSSSSSSTNNDKTAKTLVVHSGLWDMAQAIYEDIKQYIEWSAPSHRIVLTGHSIGGSLALMVLFLMTMDRGVDFVKRKVLRCYMFGSPPVVATTTDGTDIVNHASNDEDEILQAFDLPTEMVHSFVQPWDPIARLFTKEDPLYPLISDVGEEWDGVTPWPHGPPRTLRHIIKAIFESWDGWPRFRDQARGNMGLQDYSSVGVQFILLPEPSRYLADRFLSVNIAVPPVQAVLRISSRELLPSLVKTFPLDVFEISFIPQALRGFIHHFFPAYGTPFADYVTLLKEQKERPRSKKSEMDYSLGEAAAARSRTSTTTATRDEELLTTASVIPHTDEDFIMMQDKALRNNISVADSSDDKDNKDDNFGWMRAAPWLQARKEG